MKLQTLVRNSYRGRGRTSAMLREARDFDKLGHLTLVVGLSHVHAKHLEREYIGLYGKPDRVTFAGPAETRSGYRHVLRDHALLEQEIHILLNELDRMNRLAGIDE